ncbi:MAG: serine/threonine protein kinase [Planctomycetes bacterium]|nr:serine/threonine protein kinase [Planctomycetota bacterium]
MTAPTRLEAPQRPTDKVTIGREVGKYSLKRKLGQATSGVFLADSPEGPVAIKLLPAEIMANSPTLGKRFLREARTLFNKVQPNLVKTLDAGEELGTFFLVMEYFEGEDLEQVLESRGRLPEAEVVSIALQVARGLSYLRDEGLLHRNVKPEHILLGADGTTVKLAGLGLVRAEDGDEGMPAVTVKGALVGTPAYMSPEQARADDLDIRSDLYTLGITIYHLLTGELPFQAKVVAQILRQLTRDPCPDVRAKAPDVSPGLAAVIARLTEKKQEDRYANPNDLITDLEAIRTGDLVEGLPPIAGMAAGTAAGSSKVRATQVGAAGADARLKRMRLAVIGLVVVVLGLVIAIVLLTKS